MRLLVDTNIITYILRDRAIVLSRFTGALKADAAFAANLWAEIHRTGRSTDDRDLLIAISALKEEAMLVTNNTRHFEGLGIPLVDWAAE
jgi:predicted nucleic acid-binding protein